ncbi:unnamed protein product [Nezara viridula]|uniref:Uncharacterized protein n=1 Tax=Nezara viridula TaxID=85310 RepID=A0A9P0HBB4_NEZVI|nr:unnamed protein product [Nezara viridula]
MQSIVLFRDLLFSRRQERRVMRGIPEKEGLGWSLFLKSGLVLSGCSNGLLHSQRIHNKDLLELCRVVCVRHIGVSMRIGIEPSGNDHTNSLSNINQHERSPAKSVLIIATTDLEMYKYKDLLSGGSLDLRPHVGKQC